jgi:8-oxo-dGTP diphosphatase
MGFTYKHPHPAVTVDIAIFSIRHDALHVLLIKRAEAPFAGQWALPGGFVGIDEALEAAAARELKEETGVDAGYLEQLYTFGAPARDPRERVISVAYFALIPSDKLEIKAATDAEGVAWYPVAELPPLAFDHAEILAAALARLQAKLEYSTIAFQLMPAAFTISELRHVYERIAMAPIDKRNFSKKMLALGAIEETGEERRDGAHRPAKLYRVVDPTRVDVIK